MSTPSTVWAQLSTPLSPVGSVPFVGSDGVSIITDVNNFFYSNAVGTGNILAGQLKLSGGVRFGYENKTSTPGSVTLNQITGRVTIPAGQSFINVTNSACFGTSIILLTLLNADTTLTRIVPVASDGAFTLSGNAAATANVTVAFVIVNVVV